MFKYLIKNKKGMGTVEVVIIIAILVALALIFREFIFQLAQTLFDKIQDNAQNAMTDL